MQVASRIVLGTLLVIGFATTSSLAADPPSAYIIGGSAAPDGAAPYAAYLEMTPGDGYIYNCTGSLIAPQYVLTAGHCAFAAGNPIDPSAFEVTIGLSDRSTATAMTLRHVTAVRVYPYYNAATLRGDVALLALDQPAAAGTATIPLATAAEASLYAAGQPVTTMGWGRTSNTSGTPTLLQMGTAAVRPNATCNLSGSSFSPSYDLCVSAPGFVPSTCRGDSGGPLVASTPTGPIEIGVLSYTMESIFVGPFASGCGVAPDYFTRASSIESWVSSVVDNTPTPPVFVPPFLAPAPPTAVLNADGIVATFAAPAADPATLATGFVANLLNADGAPVSTQTLRSTVTSTSFPRLQPGTYTVSVSVTYSEGASTATASAPVTLAPPMNATLPAITGKGIVGSTLTCQAGTWVWPGTSTIAPAWLRDGLPTGATTSTYRLSTADAGKMIACQVRLTASTGPIATATSAAVLARAKLAVIRAPRLTGAPAVGKKLRCLAGTWTHTGPLTLRYRWLRDRIPLSGSSARAAKRTVRAADVRHRLSCRVTAVADGQTVSVTTSSFVVPRVRKMRH